MLRLFNSLGKKYQLFHPANKNVVKIFTCGPSVYQKAHIGNFRTFLFEDILVRYLEYKGYTVLRGMNFTDIEDKTIQEAEKTNMPLRKLTDMNIKEFIREMKLLRIKIPDHLSRASESVNEAAEIINQLLHRGIAYWHKGNVYFDPQRSPRFGELYGLDMSKWPKKKKRFHKDTYPGIQWNLGDFILWHGCRKRDRYCWETEIGSGRPSWNIQDPSMIIQCCNETLSVYCGGIDNLYRHHDYTKAILESVKPYPLSKFWLHCHHLYVDGRKMSKSKGNILYTDTLMRQGYASRDIRFFLIYGHYRSKLNYSEERFQIVIEKLRAFQKRARSVRQHSSKRTKSDNILSKKLQHVFEENMDRDLNVRGAFDSMYSVLSQYNSREYPPEFSSCILSTLQDIDCVLKVIF